MDGIVLCAKDLMIAGGFVVECLIDVVAVFPSYLTPVVWELP
jgi:hypothetical protein